MRDTAPGALGKSKAITKGSKSGPADADADGKKRFEVKKACDTSLKRVQMGCLVDPLYLCSGTPSSCGRGILL